ncbi:helicase IV [Clostridium acetireducens DSM 10703]|uniref:Helicase IV n=1 Tax=Clostridium acetireducens DSM 10703 TaxID=1121290 RepID=A0A1E8F1G3_9CLOT|nr:UvrD-helicase domain-containing protein [Clostridium acetireducens]OFI07448.1 helicase IV [Clostridium acetireducens DSM 10703]
MNKYKPDRELKKQIEINHEKDRLKYVINSIKNEILNLISKRKGVVSGILKCRKKAVEEYKDDEDKIIEYFDHEKFIEEESYKYIDNKLREYTILAKSPYFGKIVFEEEDYDDVDTIYIGRFGIIPEGGYEPLVIDWRAPISSLFYSGKLGEEYYIAPKGKIKVNIINKRQFIIKKSQLLGMFDSEIDIKDEMLQVMLSKNSSEKLKDIVMTIQTEQDNLIRQSRKKTIIVDGVAGSGKTTVALHRVAYLLYNYRNVLQDKVLILGPNEIFMEYISRVLPSLGEIGVRQTTFIELALSILELDEIMSFKDYMEKILAGDEKFINKVVHKNSYLYVNELNNIIKHLDKIQYDKIQCVKFGDKVIVEEKEIKDMYNNYYKDMPLFRRLKKIKRIIYSRIKDERDKYVRHIEKEYKRELSKLDEDQLEIYGSDLDFKRKLAIKKVMRDVIKVKKDITWIKICDVVKIYKEFNKEELIYDDLSAILYLKIKLEGYKLKDEIKHIIIDEAQDYSVLQFIVIKELTKCNSFTIVGDSNQRIIPIKEDIPMVVLEKYIKDLDIEHFNLLKSYRSTKEIMEYANKYLDEKRIVPIVRSGKDVVEKKLNSQKEIEKDIINTINKLKEKGYENIAIITRNLKCVQVLGNRLKDKIHLKVFENENINYNGGEVILTSYLSKGLEFDAVILYLRDKNKNYNYLEENKLMYVMATRALHELYVYF